MNKFRIKTLEGKQTYIYHIDLGADLPGFSCEEQYEVYTDLLYINGRHVLSQIDKALCELSGNQPAFRMAKLKAGIECICQEIGLDINTLDMNPVELADD
jgi:hypothetical protein